MENKQNNNKLLSPTNDIVFQCLFGKQKNESFTRDFISKILQREISELNLKENPKLIPEYPKEKYGVVDIKAKEKLTGIVYDVEMQTTASEELADRMLYYWSRIYSEQLERGGQYTDLKPVILIMILKNKLSITKEIKESHTEWKIIENKGRKIVLTNNFEMHIIEMEKYTENVSKKEKDELKEWIEFLEHPERGAKMGENKEIQKARKELERISADAQIRRMAQLREKWELDERSFRAEALEKGLKEGREKGIKEGREKGIKEGIKEGEKNKEKEIAKKLKEMKLSIQDIQKATGLTEEEIQKL